MVERALIVPPASQLGPISDVERRALIDGSIVAGVYEKTVDRESAYEILKGRAAQAANGATAAPGVPQGGTVARGGAATPADSSAGGAVPAAADEPGFFDKIGGMFGGAAASPRGSLRRESVVEAMAKSAARAVGSQVGREIIRGVLGSIFGGGRRR